jgi:hypothetical protein
VGEDDIRHRCIEGPWYQEENNAPRLGFLLVLKSKQGQRVNVKLLPNIGRANIKATLNHSTPTDKSLVPWKCCTREFKIRMGPYEMPAYKV